MRTYLFAGPTLPDAHKLISPDIADILPPIAAGDLLRLSPAPGDRVAIIDGYFHQARAIPHKEILAFLEGGVRVLGASSMGALRAAELRKFGMIGIGAVYDDFVHGRIEADDEVAVQHGPADSGYRVMSEALVNIRATLAEAERAGLLTSAQRNRLIASQVAIPYQERSFRRLIECARDVLAEDQLAMLAGFCRQEAVNQKRLDALLLAEELRADVAEALRVPEPVARTLFLYSWQLAARKLTDGEASDLAALRALQVLAPDYPSRYRRLVMSWLADRCRDECGTDPGLPDEVAAVAHGTHAGRYAAPGDEPGIGPFSHWLAPGEEGLSWHEQAVRFLVRSFRIAPGIIFDELPLRAFGHALHAARKTAALAAYVNTRTGDTSPGFDVMALDEAKVGALLTARWECAPEDLVFAAMDRGFDSQADALAAARHLYLLAEYNPDHIRLRLGDPAGSGDAQPMAPDVRT